MRVFKLFSVLLFTTLVIHQSSHASETCSPEMRRDLDELSSSELGRRAEGLALAIGLLPNAPASAKDKEQQSFCDSIRQAAKDYKDVAEKLLPGLSSETHQKLKPSDAYINSAFQLVALQVSYCDEKNCDGSFFESKNCRSKVIQERLDILRKDVPRIRELFNQVRSKKNSCDQSAFISPSNDSQETDDIAGASAAI